jgi:2-keto-4-pentenoate hydratase
LVIGNRAADTWRGLDRVSFAPRGIITGKGEWPGLGANVLGDPRKAMTWLVNELSALGIPARAGQFVTTGTCVIPMPIAVGDHITADFGGLGNVDTNIT